VKYGSKYVSLKDDDPYTVTLERALEVIRLKQEADANRIITDFGVDNIQVLNGRYGPYVTDGKKNAKVPKDREPKSLVLEECRALLAQAPERGKGRFGRGRGRRGAPAPAAAAPGAPATGTNGNGRPPAKSRVADTTRVAVPHRAKASAERSNGGKADISRRRPAAAAKKPAKKKALPGKAARKATPSRPRGVK